MHLNFEFEKTAKLLEGGDMDGFVNLGSFRVDKNPGQARRVREFV
ncbi:MAG: hypothetical protein QXF24_05015 [Thermoproteota archaeon]